MLKQFRRYLLAYHRGHHCGHHRLYGDAVGLLRRDFVLYLLQPLSLSVLIHGVKNQYPDAKITAIKVKQDPAATVSLTLTGKGGTVFVDPYTGDILAKDSRIYTRSKMKSEVCATKANIRTTSAEKPNGRRDEGPRSRRTCGGCKPPTGILR